MKQGQNLELYKFPRDFTIPTFREKILFQAGKKNCPGENKISSFSNKSDFKLNLKKFCRYYHKIKDNSIVFQEVLFLFKQYPLAEEKGMKPIKGFFSIFQRGFQNLRPPTQEVRVLLRG